MKNRNIECRQDQEVAKSMRDPLVSRQRSSLRSQVRLKSDYFQKIYQRVSLITILVPSIGTLVAIALLWYSPIGSVEVALLVTLYALTIFGVEVGFHRYFSHHAFQTTMPIRVTLAILGSMAAQGGVVFGVAHHRCHHQYTDRVNDPHSPHLAGENTLMGKLRGLWHAQMGWILKGEIPNSMVFAKDILRDPAIAKVNQWQQVWVLIGLIIPTILGGIVHGTWMGALQGFLWGGLVRIFLGQQVINATNSIGHFFGGRPFQTDDYSTNNIWLAIPSWGESWHNNHHAFPNSAVVGLRWWQIDPGYWVIWILEKLGLAWNVKKISPAQEKSKAR